VAHAQVHLVARVQVAHAQPVRVHRVQAELHAQVAPVVHVQLSVALVQVSAGEQPVAAQHQHSGPLVQVVARVVAVVVQAVAPLAPSVKAAVVVSQRHVSQSARNAKSLNREATLRRLVVQLFHAAMAAPSSVCVVAPAFKILPTRLMQMPVS
jgi:hypothetical protein